MEFLVLLAFPMVACGCFPGHRSDLSSGLLALTLTTLPRQAETELFNDMFSFMWHVASMLSFASEDIYDQYMQRYHLSTMKKIVPPECVTAGLPHPRTVDEVSKTPVPQLMLSALDLVQAWITASEDLPLPGLVPHRVFNYYSLLFLLEQGIQSYVKPRLGQPGRPSGSFFLGYSGPTCPPPPPTLLTLFSTQRSSQNNPADIG
ncbi:uncharacterized protein LOC119949681 isoform X4 [Tachyglossus aculeatus]|uniref:uncharacterized protein LOC119949681 isoform X4 n=1 Tax=Tachyglossus aculeatus TaxID=9261 RepID=UPI0018F3C3CE|nr:uncharacterized protein LOC119949681 isoform X4 [Tachyglossus aculeatus]